jgi:RND family efflux transporter MFP subunit
MSETKKESSEKGKSGFRQTVRKIVIRFFIPACIILAAVLTAKYQMSTAPKAERRKPARQGKLVTVGNINQTDTVTYIEAMGTVRPARRTTLSPEVTGRLLYVSEEVIPGGIVKKDQELFRVDSRDYETAVETGKSDLAKARHELKLEEGKQDLARQEYQMLNDQVEGQDRELILRKPQLASARASVQAAQANLEKAKLDVRRCSIEAPYNGIITQKNTDLGAIVSSSSSMAEMIGTDEYWIEVQVPVDKLKWIDVPKNSRRKGSLVKVYNEFAWDEGTHRQGHVLRLRGQLEEQGRMAQLLVSVPDPLGLTESKSEEPRLLVGSYVKARIRGKKLEDVVGIERKYVHNGDEVWIMNDQNRLEIRKVKIAFRDKKKVYIKAGITPDEQIVTSDMAAPIDGMALRVENSDERDISLDISEVSNKVSDSNEQ